MTLSPSYACLTKWVACGYATSNKPADCSMPPGGQLRQAACFHFALSDPIEFVGVSTQRGFDKNPFLIHSKRSLCHHCDDDGVRLGPRSTIKREDYKIKLILPTEISMAVVLDVSHEWDHES